MVETLFSTVSIAQWAPVLSALVFGVAIGWLIWGVRSNAEADINASARVRAIAAQSDEGDSVQSNQEPAVASNTPSGGAADAETKDAARTAKMNYADVVKASGGSKGDLENSADIDEAETDKSNSGETTGGGAISADATSSSAADLPDPVAPAISTRSASTNELSSGDRKRLSALETEIAAVKALIAGMDGEADDMSDDIAVLNQAVNRANSRLKIMMKTAKKLGRQRARREGGLAD